MKFIVALLSFLLLSASTPPRGNFLFVWTMDADAQQSDFLAVIDLDRASPSFGKVVATLPTDRKSVV